ncbi:SpoIIE family protein phosphatase [Saccharospirillum sp. HFRX-1]|uniref:PP2C family protein-serine/threonine phosphatase n=1 Tax=unclassified Saccharospirillum TaxID=2633430 RepID=UPI00371FB487
MSRDLEQQYGPDVDEAVKHTDFDAYQTELVHGWLRTVAFLATGLVPLFFVLDVILLPHELIPLFALYRGLSTALILLQFVILSRTQPGPLSYFHGYFASFQIGGFIALMTVHLGGFDNGYYVGLILVIIGVNLLLPWRGKHTGLNTLIIIGMYLGLNFAHPQPYDGRLLVNNLFFLCSSGILAVSINELRHRLIANEFSLLIKLKEARDSLWGEMELAQRIQMSLLPRQLNISGYDIAALMEPAQEVGGDYYEVFETETGARYVAIGDVAGHGLNAGLIMMMVQTSLMTLLKAEPDCSPVRALETINAALRENVGRLGSDHYMTMTILKLGDEIIEIAGHHQDILVHRYSSNSLEIQPTTGTWLGITDDLRGLIDSLTLTIEPGDTLLLFTDGLTEAGEEHGEMFGQQNLEKLFRQGISGQPGDIARTVLDGVKAYQQEQDDDMTALVVRRCLEHSGKASAGHGSQASVATFPSSQKA